ncbi:hypothetical protein OH492_27325 [Vibrio chagasii]|nr:hypothetical protein [Vibrio chagasii]
MSLLKANHASKGAMLEIKLTNGDCNIQLVSMVGSSEVYFAVKASPQSESSSAVLAVILLPKGGALIKSLCGFANASGLVYDTQVRKLPMGSLFISFKSVVVQKALSLV